MTPSVCENELYCMYVCALSSHMYVTLPEALSFWKLFNLKYDSSSCESYT